MFWQLVLTECIRGECTRGREHKVNAVLVLLEICLFIVLDMCVLKMIMLIETELLLDSVCCHRIKSAF